MKREGSAKRLLFAVLLLLHVGTILFGQGGKPQIQTDSPLPAGTVGTPYSQTLRASGGTAPYTWSVPSGTLPGGLTLSSAGVLAGTPAATGTFDFTVRVVDSSMPPQNAQKGFKLSINLVAVSITTTSPLPSGTVGTSYSQTFAATGGTAPYTWSLASGSLPPGMNLSSGGVLGGTPTAEGSFNFTIRVTESQASYVQKAFSLTVVASLSITTGSTLPSGVVGTAYSQTLTATGGTAPYTWSLASGSLPQGMNLSSSGVLGGTPTAGGSFNFTIRVTDSSAAPQSTQKAFSLTVIVPVSITTGSTLPSGVVGAAYSQTLIATGGTGPYSWSLASGSLPQGLNLSSSGVISGTPSAEGSFNFTIRVTDSGAAPDTQKAFSLTVVAPVSITTSPALPSGTVGTAYSQTLTATGGTPPYNWSLVAGSLPAGLSLSASGILRGTPNAAGTFNFTIGVTDSAQQNTQRAFSLSIVPVGTPLSITTTSPLPSGIVGTSYSTQLQATGGTGPYRWSLASGVLAQGLTLSSDGLLSGTPTTAGSVSFTIQVTDRSVPQQTANQAFSLTIVNPTNLPSLTLTGVPSQLNPTQQQPIALALSAPYPAPLSGTLTLSFTPNAVGATDDPFVMFSTGSRTVSFSVAANSTVAIFPSPVLVLAGTVAGSINLAASLQGNQPQGVGSVTVRLLPPQVRNIVATRIQGGLRVEVTAYSPQRTVQRVDFEFRVRTAAGIESVNLGRSVDSEFQNWYGSPTSAAFGSSFVYMQSFGVDGDVTIIESVGVSLSNAQGSTSGNATFGN